MNSRDAERLGVADGDMVRVVSRRGTVVAPAKVGEVRAPGVVFVPFHYGAIGETHAANNLTPAAWDPVSDQPIQKIAAVRVELVRSTMPPSWWQREQRP